MNTVIPPFHGFVKPEKNYFPTPNEWIDISAEIDNLAELKVVQYVLRHTWGYQEYGIKKAITVDEFMHGRKRHDGSRIDKGTGLKSDRSVKDGIKLAIEHGYLVCEVDDEDKGRIKKYYALKMLELEGYNLPPKERNKRVQSTPQRGTIYPSDSKNIPLNQAESTPRTEKDTLERHLRKTPEKDTSICIAPIGDNAGVSSQIFLDNSIAVDDLEHPTCITVYLTSEEVEIEDDRRSIAADELKWKLEQKQGYAIQLQFKREEEAKVVADKEACDVPIAKATAKKPRTKKVQTEQMEFLVTPVVPPATVSWCAETAVQIVEAKKGYRYTPSTRKSELREAQKALEIQIQPGETATREQFEQAWESIESWETWKKNNIEPMIRHLVKDDRIRTLVKPRLRIVSRGTEKPVTSTRISSFDDPNYDMEDEFYPSEAERRAAHATR